MNRKMANIRLPTPGQNSNAVDIRLVHETTTPAWQLHQGRGVTCAARGQMCRARISVLLVNERLLWRAVANMNSGALGSRPELQ